MSCSLSDSRSEAATNAECSSSSWSQEIVTRDPCFIGHSRLCNRILDTFFVSRIQTKYNALELLKFLKLVCAASACVCNILWVHVL